MPFIPSPAILLIGLIGILSAFGGGAATGYKYSEGKHATALNEALITVAEAARRDAALESAKALESATRLQAQKAHAREQRLKLEAALELEKAINSCSIGPVTFGVLRSAIATSNGAKTATGSVDGAVREAK